VKRLADLLLSLFGLGACSPLIGALWIAIRIDSPGPALFTQIRTGRNGQPFRIFKLRTLLIDQCRYHGEDEIREGDPRVTRLGKFLRRYTLDELPQLLNVLLGQMSFVGPRPDLPEQAAKYTAAQAVRLTAVPGLTGVSQISGNASITWDERIRMDIWYVRNASLTLDLGILLRTIKVVVAGESVRQDPYGLRNPTGPGLTPARHGPA